MGAGAVNDSSRAAEMPPKQEGGRIEEYDDDRACADPDTPEYGETGIQEQVVSLESEIVNLADELKALGRYLEPIMGPERSQPESGGGEVVEAARPSLVRGRIQEAIGAVEAETRRIRRMRERLEL